MRRLALLAALVVLAGCDSDGGAPGAPSDAGGSPAQTGGSPEQTAREHVEALGAGDGSRFCALLAPYIRGTLELAAHSYWGARERQAARDAGSEPGCPLVVETFTGRRDEAGLRWRRADVLAVGTARQEGELTAVDLRLRHHYAGRGSQTESDRVYLARFGGDWRVAKLSAVAERAKLAGFTRDSPAGPPDIRAEQARYAGRKAEYDARQRRERGTFHKPGRRAGCAGRLRRVADGAGDVTYQSAPQPVDRPAADIRSAALAATRRSLCLTVELGARPDARMFVLLRLPGAAPITADRREDGVWRIISGEDERGHPRVIQGRVGERGRRVSLVVRRRSPLPQRFPWGVELLTPDVDAGQMLVDRTPER
jgi:hypothetical protein